MAALHCACGRIDTVIRDEVTNAPLCPACFKVLGDFIGWTHDERAFNESRHEWEHLWPGRQCDICAAARH